MAMNNILVENAKIMAKGQITLPKDIREFLGVGIGDRVTLICRDNQVIKAVTVPNQGVICDCRRFCT